MFTIEYSNQIKTMKKIFLFASAAALVMGSCSKDLTEEAAGPSISGKSKIVASYNVDGTETRTHLEYLDGPNGGFKYYWDKSDAVGVFDADIADDVTNATFQIAEPGISAVFEGDLDMFAGNNYFVYYPYAPGIALKDGVLTMQINGNQNYSHAAAAKGVPEGNDIPEGSFAQNAAPAIAKGVADEDNRLAVTFNTLASYIVTPIKGFGTVNKVQLKIKQKSGDYANLAGKFTVKVADLSTDFTSLDEETITLNCGKGVELNPEVATNFWFVVPSDIDMREATLELYINGWTAEDLNRTFAADFRKETEGVTGVNRVNWWGKTSDEDFFYDPENHYLIENADQFLEYVYAATNGYAAVSALDGFEDSYAFDMFVNTDTTPELKPAILIKDIDMSEVATNGTRYDEVDKLNAYVKAVYFFGYQENGSTISTIGGKMDFTIDGKFNDKIATIKNLKVKGTSLFYDGYSKGEFNETVKNVKFVDVTVNAKGEKEATFLTSRFKPGDRSIVFSNVTVGTGCEVVADEGVDKALVNRAFTDALVDIENETELVYANTLNVFNHEVWFTGEKAITADYNAITVHKTYAGAILHVADKEAAVKMIGDVSEDSAWFSVVDAETSYWTGFTATKVTEDDYFTAEELALAVKNRNDIMMTNDIDLMDKPWPIVKEEALFTIDGVGKYTISNINIDGTKVEEQTATKNLYYTTFGKTANAKNLTLKKVVISVKEGDTTPHIAAVANTPGSATANVTVDGLKITTDAACADGIGGLFGSLTKTSATAGTFNYLKGCTIKDVDVEGVAEGLAYGDLAGKFTITVGNDLELTVENLATYSNKAFGSIVATVGTKAVEGSANPTVREPAYKSTTLDFSNFKAPVEEGDIDWVAQNSSATIKYNLTGFVLFVTNDGAGEWHMIHE